jgi:hypothetical protein
LENQMSIDEGKLRASLSAALDDLDCGPLPLKSVISQGKGVLWRRRLTAGSGALIVAAAAVAAPVIAHQDARPAQAAAAGHYHVTVHAPGPHSPTGLVAYGRLNHRRWQLTGTSAQFAGFQRACFRVFGRSCQFTAVTKATGKGEPGDFRATVGQAPMTLIGDVRADIRRVQVSLSNGQTLTLRPVPIFGHAKAAWVGLMVPYPAAVTLIRAYSAKGEVGYAVPFGRGTLFSAARWLVPGQLPRPRPQTSKIASGQVKGRSWAEYAFVGPWGTCISGSGAGGQCFTEGLRQLAAEEVLEPVLIVSPGHSGIGYNVFVAERAASYLIAHFKNAASIRVPFVSKDGVKIAAFTAVPAYAMTRWYAYTASGELLAAGGQSSVTAPGSPPGS